MTNNTKRNDKTKDNASRAASTMGRKDASHEEKSRAASELGRKGGEHSHSSGRSKSN